MATLYKTIMSIHPSSHSNAFIRIRWLGFPHKTHSAPEVKKRTPCYFDASPCYCYYDNDDDGDNNEAGSWAQRYAKKKYSSDLPSPTLAYPRLPSATLTNPRQFATVTPFHGHPAPLLHLPSAQVHSGWRLRHTPTLLRNESRNGHLLLLTFVEVNTGRKNIKLKFPHARRLLPFF